jgi:tetratricopeptide (TPR) repeat protein
MNLLRTRIIAGLAVLFLPVAGIGMAGAARAEVPEPATTGPAPIEPVPAELAAPSPAVLYAEGAYAEAVAAALAHGDAGMDALAARALLAQARLARRGERAGLVGRALEAARRAVARDPQHLEGNLQLALALGYQGRAMGNLAAHQRGLAEEARAAIDTALAVAPDNPWAQALLGSWHVEIVTGAGPLLAATLYGASLDEGLKAFRAAEAHPEVSLLVLHQMALHLLSYDSRSFARQAERMLMAARARDAGTHFERHMARQADRLLRALRSGSHAMLAREIERERLTF